MMAPLIPIPELLKVDQKSPLYNERDRASIFYARAWGLMHMLMLSPEYSAKFGKFISTLQSGMSAQSALETVTGRSSAQILETTRPVHTRRELQRGSVRRKLESHLRSRKQDPLTAWNTVWRSG